MPFCKLHTRLVKYIPCLKVRRLVKRLHTIITLWNSHKHVPCNPNCIINYFTNQRNTII